MAELKRGDYSRENLIAICEAAVVDVGKWLHRDSPSAHEQLGLCWVMLKAGCEFFVHFPIAGKMKGCFTDEHTIWLTVEWPSFETFEYGGGHKQEKIFYLPTPKTLEENTDRDWY